MIWGVITAIVAISTILLLVAPLSKLIQNKLSVKLRPDMGRGFGVNDHGIKS